MKIEVTTDKEHFDKVKSRMKEIGGHCPCQIKRTEDTKCICKNFREETPVGEWCICGIYKKIEE